MASSFKRSDTLALKYLENPEVVSARKAFSVTTRKGMMAEHA